MSVGQGVICPPLAANGKPGERSGGCHPRRSPPVSAIPARAADLALHPMAAINESETQGTNAGFVPVEVTGLHTPPRTTLFELRSNRWSASTGSDLAVPAPADSTFAAVAVYACKNIGKNQEIVTHYGNRFHVRPYVPRKACRPPRAREQAVLALGRLPRSTEAPPGCYACPDCSCPKWYCNDCRGVLEGDDAQPLSRRGDARVVPSDVEGAPIG